MLRRRRARPALSTRECPVRRRSSSPWREQDSAPTAAIVGATTLHVERGEYHTALARLVAVMDQVACHESNVPLRRRPDIGAPP